jgi:alcohol dehydrogenase
MTIDEIEKPSPRANDVLIQVKSCGVIPNMNSIFSGKLWNHLPPLPASVGLDAAGVVAETGGRVVDIRVGDRVYVNPWLSCGQCTSCRTGEPLMCSSAALQGYFGFFPTSRPQLDAYPYGGFSEYMTASAQRLVKLQNEVSFDQAARFGYLGTSFAGLRAGKVVAGTTVAINGITGTLGVGATLLALGMGATRILGLGRNANVMKQLKALAPNRIDTLALGAGSIVDWLRERTGGIGVDVLLDCSGRSASSATTSDALNGVKRGGAVVNIGSSHGAIVHRAVSVHEQSLAFTGIDLVHHW